MSDSSPRRAGVWWVAVGAALLGAAIGVEVHRIFSTPTPVLALDPAQMIKASDDGTYSFIPFRRNLWVIHHETDTVRFFMFPATDEKPVQPSRIYNIDRNEFPADEVRYLVSDHNLTNFLWITNPRTGKVRFLKALRDGKIEASRLLDVTQQQ